MPEGLGYRTRHRRRPAAPPVRRLAESRYFHASLHLHLACACTQPDPLTLAYMGPHPHPTITCRGHRLVDAAVFEPVPFRSAIADGCTHLLVLCTRPTHLTRRSRVNTALSDAMEVAIKKAVMSPDYMLPAWQVRRGGC